MPPVKRYTTYRKRMETDTLARNRKKSQKKAMVKNAMVIPPPYAPNREHKQKKRYLGPGSMAH